MKDWPVNLGPVFTDLTCTPNNPIFDYSDPTTAGQVGLGYNPRCLKRDISKWTSSQWSNDKMVVKLLDSKDMKTFWYDMQGGENPFSNNFMGVHTAGHFTVGADPGSDFLASPGDPYFYGKSSFIANIDSCANIIQLTTLRLTASGGHGRTCTLQNVPRPSTELLCWLTLLLLIRHCPTR
jgi:hypothetical protein